MNPRDHERATIRAFVVKDRRKRWLESLDHDRLRAKVCNQLAHNAPLDMRFATHIPPCDQWADSVFELLRARGAPETCVLISESSELDGRTMPLIEALRRVIGYGMGTIVCCVPGRLAYFEAEDCGERYLLERTEGASWGRT